MARGREFHAAVEPSFILGQSKAGEKFVSMSVRHQILYLRLWCSCIQMRTEFVQSCAQLARKLGANHAGLSSMLRECCAKDLAKFMGGETYKLLGIREKHAGYRFKSSPYGEQTGNGCAPDDPHMGRTVTETETPTPLPPTPVFEPKAVNHPREAGGQAGEVLDKPSQPACEVFGKPVEPTKAPAWESVLKKFPAVERKAVARHAIRAKADGIGKPFDLVLAAVVEVCEDEEAGRTKITHSPLSLACARLRDGKGLRNGTLMRVRKAMGLEPDKPKPAVPVVIVEEPKEPPTREQLADMLERAEASGNRAMAQQIRKVIASSGGEGRA